MASVVLLAVAAYGAGRVARLRVGKRAAPLAVTALGVVALLVPTPEPLSLANAGFLEYSNANGSFFVLTAFAALLAMSSARSANERLGLAAVLVFFVSLPYLGHARSATISAAFLLPGLWIVIGRRGHRPILVAAALLTFAVIVGTFLLARKYTSEYVAHRDYRSAAGLFGRANFWASGYRIFVDHSLIGVGPGGYQEASFFGTDEDGRWTHNEFLQTAAETGFFGLLFLLGLLGWSFWALARPPTDASTVAALMIAAFAVNASTDYLLHIPLLTATAAVLTGSSVPVGSRAAGKRVARRA